MAQYEGRWNCKHCSRVNRGGSVECEGCGKDRPANVEFYLPENAPPITDPVLLEKADRPPDRHCAHCGSVMSTASSPGGMICCSKCGGTTSTPYETLTFPKEAFERVNVVNCGRSIGKSTNIVDSVPTRPVGLAWSTRDYALLLRGMAGITLVFVGIAGAIALIYFLAFGTRTAKLQSKNWLRTVQVEDLKTFRETDWHNHLPIGARQVRSFTALRYYDHVRTGSRTEYRTVTDRVQTGTRRVKTGTRNKGNGFFEDVYETRPVYETRSRQEPYSVPTYTDIPVYDTKVEYDIDRWVPGQVYRADGTNDAPHWPNIMVGPNQRRGNAADSYRAVFKDSKGETVEKIVNEAQYNTLNAQVTYKLNTAFGSVTDVQELQAEKSE